MGSHELDPVGADGEVDGDGPVSPLTGRAALGAAIGGGIAASLLAAALWLSKTATRNAVDRRSVPAPIASDPHLEVGATAAESGRPSPAPLVAAPPVDEVATEPMHPHPITPERERIQGENRLIGAMNDAMDLSDGPSLRKILDEYRHGYPEDPSGLQAGYAIVADCLERPGTESRAAAARYFETERGSILRRFVARHCLEEAQ
jgi:hypothetical protein